MKRRSRNWLPTSGRITPSSVVYPTVEKILILYEQLVSYFAKTDVPIGAVYPPNLNKLEFAVERPKTALFCKDLKTTNEQYPNLYMKAAVIAQSIIKGHIFSDGNKRVGLLTAEQFLENNGKFLELSDDDFYNLAMDIADGRIKLDAIAGKIGSNCRDYKNWFESRLKKIDATPRKFLKKWKSPS